jgi:hypothetical protein
VAGYGTQKLFCWLPINQVVYRVVHKAFSYSKKLPDLCSSEVQMHLRKATYLTRILLVLICFQFTSPVLVAGSVEKKSEELSITPHKHPAKPVNFSTLFEKDEKEGKEERTKFTTIPLQNISLTYRVRLTTYQAFHLTTVSAHVHQPPLFRLHCIYLI